MAKKMGYDVGTPQPTSITILIRKGNYTRVWLPKKNAANAASRIVQCELCSKSKKDLPIKIFFFFLLGEMLNLRKPAWALLFGGLSMHVESMEP